LCVFEARDLLQNDESSDLAKERISLLSDRLSERGRHMRPASLLVLATLVLGETQKEAVAIGYVY